MRTRVARRVCAVFAVAALSACAGADATGPKVSVSGVKVQLTGCPQSASPLPGWRNCTGTVTLTATGTPPSGYFSVYMDYGSSGTFYHGSIAGGTGTQSYVINIVADYVPQCLTSVPTSVDVYDGPPSDSNAPLITSIKLTLTGSC